jgi:hypothetical protein
MIAPFKKRFLQSRNPYEDIGWPRGFSSVAKSFPGTRCCDPWIAPGKRLQFTPSKANRVPTPVLLTHLAVRQVG